MTMRSGQLDFIERVAASEMEKIVAEKKLKTASITEIGYQGITVNIGNKNGVGKAYQNVGTEFARSAGLRRAFSLALDRNGGALVVYSVELA